MAKSKQHLRFKGNDWLIFPLAIIVLLCVLALGQSQITYANLFTLPTFTVILIGLFSLFYAYRRITHKYIRVVATAVVYIFSIIVIGALALTIIAPSASGAIFFIWIVTLSPFSATILSLLSATGIVVLAIPKRNKTSKRHTK